MDWFKGNTGVECTQAFLSKKTPCWTVRKWRKMTACVAARLGAASSQWHGDYQTLPGQNAACLLSPQETGKPSLCDIHHLLLCQGRGLSRRCFTCLWMSALQDGMQVSGGGCCMCGSGVKWLHEQTPVLFSWAKKLGGQVKEGNNTTNNKTTTTTKLK